MPIFIKEPSPVATLLLPTWSECAAAVRAGNATALQFFIYSEEPTSPEDIEFRNSLLGLLHELTTSNWIDPSQPS